MQYMYFVLSFEYIHFTNVFIMFFRQQHCSNTTATQREHNSNTTVTHQEHNINTLLYIYICNTNTTVTQHQKYIIIYHNRNTVTQLQQHNKQKHNSNTHTHNQDNSDDTPCPGYPVPGRRQRFITAAELQNFIRSIQTNAPVRV